MKQLLRTTSIIMFLLIMSKGTTMAQRLVIWQKDGTKVSYDLDERPKTTFTTEDLVITTATATINYPLAKIQRYTYEGGALSVQDIRAGGIRISHAPNLL